MSGGWAILVLCLFYWLIDVKRYFETGYNMFKVVGMNSIFIYLFFELGFVKPIDKFFVPFTNDLLFWMGPLGVRVMTSLAIWATLWYLCYWLYKNKIFFKI